MKKKLISLLLALTICLSWLPSVSILAADDAQTWSMLLYLCGSNLEGEHGLGTELLLDILDNDLPDNLKIAVYTGGSLIWDPQEAGKAYNEKVGYDAYIRPGKYNDLFFIRDNEKGKPQMYKADDAETDAGSYKPMCEANTAIEFLETVNKEDPDFFGADHVILEFMNHGGAWGGAQFDDYTEGTMPVGGIQQTVNKAAELHGGKIDIMGFNDCLMSSFEVAYYLADSAKYMVASEEVEYAPGWRHSFIDCGDGGLWPDDPTPENLAKAIVDGYVADTLKTTPFLAATLAVTDLSKMTALKESFNAFVIDIAQILSAELENDDVSTYVAIARAAETTQSMAPGYGMIDMYDFLYRVSKISRETYRAADKVIGVLGAPTGSDKPSYNGHVAEADYIGETVGRNTAVIYRGTCPQFDNSVGLSIFYPLSDMVPDIDNIMKNVLGDIYDYMGMTDTYVNFINAFVLSQEFPLFSGQMNTQQDGEHFILNIDPKEIDVIKKVELVTTYTETNTESHETQTYLLGSEELLEGWKEATFHTVAPTDWFFVNGHPITMLSDVVDAYGEYLGYDIFYYDMPVKVEAIDGSLLDGVVSVARTIQYNTKGEEEVDYRFAGLTVTVTDPDTGATVSGAFPPEGLTIYPTLAVLDTNTHEITEYVPYTDSQMVLRSDGDVPLDIHEIISGNATYYSSYFNATDVRSKIYSSDSFEYFIVNSIDQLNIKTIVPQEYTGKAVEPDIRIMYHGMEVLTEGADYEVSYSNNTEKGTATVTVTSLMDSLPGQLTAEFTICGFDQLTAETLKLLPDHDLGANCDSVPYEYFEHAHVIEQAKRYYEYGSVPDDASLAVLNSQYGLLAEAFGASFYDNGVEIIGVFDKFGFAPYLTLSAESTDAGVFGGIANGECYYIEMLDGFGSIPDLYGDRSVTLKIELADGTDTSNLRILRLTDDGSAETTEYSIAELDGKKYAVFDTDSLGYFALTCGDGNPITGDGDMSMWIIIASMSTLVMLSILIFSRTKKQNV